MSNFLKPANHKQKTKKQLNFTIFHPLCFGLTFLLTTTWAIEPGFLTRLGGSSPTSSCPCRQEHLGLHIMMRGEVTESSESLHVILGGGNSTYFLKC